MSVRTLTRLFSISVQAISRTPRVSWSHSLAISSTVKAPARSRFSTSSAPSSCAGRLLDRSSRAIRSGGTATSASWRSSRIRRPSPSPTPWGSLLRSSASSSSPQITGANDPSAASRRRSSRRPEARRSGCAWARSLASSSGRASSAPSGIVSKSRAPAPRTTAWGLSSSCWISSSVGAERASSSASLPSACTSGSGCSSRARTSPSGRRPSRAPPPEISASLALAARSFSPSPSPSSPEAVCSSSAPQVASESGVLTTKPAAKSCVSAWTESSILASAAGSFASAAPARSSQRCACERPSVWALQASVARTSIDRSSGRWWARIRSKTRRAVGS